MHSHARVLALAFFSTTVLAGAAIARTSNVQTAAVPASDDWDLQRDEATGLIAASIEYASGVGLRVQCQSGVLSLGLGGLPKATSRLRRFDATRGDGVTRSMVWRSVAEGQVLVSNAVRDARFLKTGGVLTLASTAGEADPVRVQLDLPSQSTGIDAVLEACGRPLTDLRDGLASADSLLTAAPTVVMAAPRTREPVKLELSCLVANSRLSACQVDHETPANSGAAAPTAQRANGALLQLSDPRAAEGRVIDIAVTSEHFPRR